MRPSDRRKGNDELLLGLMLALLYEHKRSTGHDFTSDSRLARIGCDTCMWLRTVSEELEARQYDDEAAAHVGS